MTPPESVQRALWKLDGAIGRAANWDGARERTMLRWAIREFQAVERAGRREAARERRRRA